MLRATFFELRDRLTPVATTSQPCEGVLTPAEFVASGEQLALVSPGWAWAADGTLEKSYLPRGRQWLVCRRLPVNVVATGPLDADFVDARPGLAAPAQPAADADDEAALVQPPLRTGIFADVHITYDNYYRTPRVFIEAYRLGPDGAARPLSPAAGLALFSAAHAGRTVTSEVHPHLGVPMVGLHPCQHAAVMAKLIARMGPAYRQVTYMMVFLKFLGSVLPAIDYDTAAC